MKIPQTINRILDQFNEWYRWPQPNIIQRNVMGMNKDVIDYEFTSKRLASESAAEYNLAKMRTTMNFNTDYDLRQYVCEYIQDLGMPGVILEFGVSTGRTINHIARECPNDIVIGLDCFDGLPHDWTNRFCKGSFKATVPKVKSNVHLVIGLFKDLSPSIVFNQIGVDDIQSIKMIHIDCDLYSSTCDIFNIWHNHIVPGTVILFDEYINYPGWQLDEFKAFQEFVSKYNITYKYIGKVSSHNQVAVEICTKG